MTHRVDVPDALFTDEANHSGSRKMQLDEVCLRGLATTPHIPIGVCALVVAALDISPTTQSLHQQATYAERPRRAAAWQPAAQDHKRNRHRVSQSRTGGTAKESLRGNDVPAEDRPFDRIAPVFISGVALPTGTLSACRGEAESSGQELIAGRQNLTNLATRHGGSGSRSQFTVTEMRGPSA
jgi:hypothetical protein